MNEINKEFLLEALYKQGLADARSLRSEASTLTGTEIIAREMAAPAFDENKDYSSWPVGSPVSDEGQIWILLQPHNAAYYIGRPSSLRSLWGLCHTTDPAAAKPWVEPYGTSGMYMKNECYVDINGKVWCSLNDNNVFTAAEYPPAWKEVIIQ